MGEVGRAQGVCPVVTLVDSSDVLGVFPFQSCFDKIHGWIVGWKSARFGLKWYLGTCGCNMDRT